MHSVLGLARFRRDNCLVLVHEQIVGDLNIDLGVLAVVVWGYNFDEFVEIELALADVEENSDVLLVLALLVAGVALIVRNEVWVLLVGNASLHVCGRVDIEISDEKLESVDHPEPVVLASNHLGYRLSVYRVVGVYVDGTGLDGCAALVPATDVDQRSGEVVGEA